MIKSLSRQLRRLVHGTREPRVPDLPRPGVLDQYVRAAPSAANIASLFQDQWLSRLPAEMGLEGGRAGLFDDARIHRLLSLIDIAGQDVLELGPLEGGHTAHFVRAGAARVTAIEANSLAFLKCLAVKEALGLENVRFLLGDFVAFLRERRHSFDLCVACGVLYHMQNPVELLELLAQACRRHLFLWTHYFDANIVAHSSDAANHLTEPQICSWKGFRHTLVRYEYRSALESETFCGGPAPFSHWLPRADLLAALDYFGFRDVRILSEEPDHPHGPSFSLAASRCH
jgi:hypothetical protein